MSDESWDKLHYLFDMIANGLQRHTDNNYQHKDAFFLRFTQEYGKENPYMHAIWDIVNTNTNIHQQLDFSESLVNIPHLVPMFASFLTNKNKDAFIISFKKNALMESLKRMIPKQRVQNFRKKDPPLTDRIHQRIEKKNNLIRTSLQQEWIGKLIATIRDNHIP